MRVLEFSLVHCNYYNSNCFDQMKCLLIPLLHRQTKLKLGNNVSEQHLLKADRVQKISVPVTVCLDLKQ